MLVGLLAVGEPEQRRARSQLEAITPVKIVLSTCAGNPGDSGSPLVDDTGRLLGITYAIPAEVRLDKFVYHVHLDSVREFLARARPEGPAIPDAWRLGPMVALAESRPGAGFDMLVAGRGRPEQVLVDVDGDTQDLTEDPDALAARVAARRFDAEAAFHFAPDRRTAFYDTDNDGTFDLILVDEDGDPEADVRFALKRGQWKVSRDLAVPWMRAHYLKFKGGAALATEKFRAITS